MVDNQENELAAGGPLEATQTHIDAPAPEELKILTNEEFYEHKKGVINRKIETYKRLHAACSTKINQLKQKHSAAIDWSEIPDEDLFAWADLEIRLFDTQAVLGSCNFELEQITKNLKAYLQQLTNWRKEMDINWDKCIEKLKEVIVQKRHKNAPTVRETNTLQRCGEEFENEEERIEWYRTMVDVLGDKAPGKK